jgi:hypothetical protein
LKTTKANAQAVAAANKARMGAPGCRGAAKAMELEVVFQGITQALLEVRFLSLSSQSEFMFGLQLYWHGCAAGPVVLDVSTVLITVIGTAVCHRVDMKQDDPKVIRTV